MEKKDRLTPEFRVLSRIGVLASCHVFRSIYMGSSSNGVLYARDFLIFLTFTEFP